MHVRTSKKNQKDQEPKMPSTALPYAPPLLVRASAHHLQLLEAIEKRLLNSFDAMLSGSGVTCSDFARWVDPLPFQ
jgi:hypothetical protein